MIKKRILKYTKGRMFFNEGVSMELNNEKPVEEIDLSHVSSEDFEKIKKDPKLIEKFKKAVII